MKCPNCDSKDTILNGFQNGTQRYKCKKCGHQFRCKEKDITAYYRNRKKVQLAIETMAFPVYDLERIAEKSGLTKRTVRRHINDLLRDDKIIINQVTIINR